MRNNSNRRNDKPGDKKPFSSKRKSREGGFSSKRNEDQGEKRSRNYSKPQEKQFSRPRKKAENEKIVPSSTGEMRLNRFIANAGICSRREADKYIQAGLVTINGQTITELGVKVNGNDEVRFDGRRLNAEKKVYLLLNKPKNFVTTTDDPHAEQTVMDLVKDACTERIYPVGRLDRNTTGLLLLTNDGDLSKKLTHPSHT